MNTRFGEYVGEARRKKGITLKKLAEFVGLAPSNLSEIEHGRRMPPKDADKLEAMSIILGLEKDKLRKLAELERKAAKPVLFDRLYAMNPEAALSLCRAQEQHSDKDFLKQLKEALKLLESGDD